MYDKYLELLLEYNLKFNLTAITEPEEVRLKHFQDSHALLPRLPKQGRVVDIGTGAGFPGIPLAIERPDLEFVLFDALRKRIGFLEIVIQKLGLKNVSAHHIRAEDAARTPVYRESFDVATSRAVTSLAVLAEYSLPLLKIGGVMLAMKGQKVYEELDDARIIQDLGGDSPIMYDYDLAGMQRCIVSVGKVNATPEKYPRRKIK